MLNSIHFKVSNYSQECMIIGKCSLLGSGWIKLRNAPLEAVFREDSFKVDKI